MSTSFYAAHRSYESSFLGEGETEVITRSRTGEAEKLVFNVASVNAAHILESLGFPPNPCDPKDLRERILKVISALQQGRGKEFIRPEVREPKWVEYGLDESYMLDRMHSLEDICMYAATHGLVVAWS